MLCTDFKLGVESTPIPNPQYYEQPIDNTYVHVPDRIKPNFGNGQSADFPGSGVLEYNPYETSNDEWWNNPFSPNEATFIQRDRDDDR